MSTASTAIVTQTYDRRYAFVLIGAFAFSWALLSTAVSAFNPLLPLIRTEFNLSGFETGLLTWAFTLPYLVTQLPAGVLADRVGAKRILVFMMLISALGLIGLGLWSYGLLALLAFAVVHRLGAGVYYPIAFAGATGAVPTTARGTASSFLVMGMALGASLGTGISVPLAEMGGNNWRFPLLVFGLALLMVPAVFQVLMRRTKHSKQMASSQVSHALRDRSLLCLFAINFCTNYGFTVVMTWGPAFLDGERGMPLAMAGFYLALANLIGFPAGLAAGLLSDRTGRKWLTVLLFAGAGAAVVAFASLDQPILVLAAVIAYGLLGKWTSDSILAAWMGDHVAVKFPSLGNSIYGLNNTARMLGALLAPPITGAFLDQTGTLATGFYLGAAVLLAAGCMTTVVGQADKRRQGAA